MSLSHQNFLWPQGDIDRTTQMISASGSYSGLGFAISANTIKRIDPEFITHGGYLYPWLGVELLDITDYSITVLEEVGIDTSVESGVMIVGVMSGSPVENAGIQSGIHSLWMGPYNIPVDGDIITALNDIPIKAHQDLMIYFETQTHVGSAVVLAVLSNIEILTLAATLAAQPNN